MPRSASSWPTGALNAVQRAFDLLCCPPQPLLLDGSAFAGLPRRTIRLDELRRLLLDPAVVAPVRDDVWRHLVCQARTGQPAWVVAAAAMALPGLRRAAAAISAGADDSADLDAELLTGFLHALRHAELSGRNVCARLIRAGERAAARLRDAGSRHEAVSADGFGSTAPARPWDHPDLVLARAVTADVITAEDAVLIGATRLDRVSLANAAAHAGISVDTARQRRHRAEHRLAAALSHRV
ncbi:hypothetical protein AB0B66_40540 [Catellatospora sp. NPDC049111]|uniref:hypothetical protein n=1 Tax=Catellatospora sp. NPDC049111 TaxID=3155271 RepID=UPI0033CEEA90